MQMQVVIIATLALLLALTASHLFFVKRELRRMAKTITAIDHTGSNERLRIEWGERAVVDLTIAINRLFQQAGVQRREMQQTTADLQQALANLSHDLRTPLTSVIGYLDLAQKSHKDSDAQQRYLHIAKERAEALNQMVNALFELSRLEAGNVPFSPERISLNSILTEELAAFFSEFEAAGLTPEVVLPQQNLYVFADAVAIHRVVENLLKNMLRHGAGKVSITMEPAEKTVHLAFRNAAPALKAEDVPQLFARSFVGDPTRGSGSTGLGLAIAKALVQKNGGEIDAALKEDMLTIQLSFPILS